MLARHAVHLVDQELDIGLQGLDRLGENPDFVLVVDVELEVEVALGHLAGGGDELADRAGDRAGDQEGEESDDQQRGDRQADDQRARRTGQSVGVDADLLGKFGLIVDKGIDILDVGVEGRAVAAVEVLQRFIPLSGLDLPLEFRRFGNESFSRLLAGFEGRLALVAVVELVERIEYLGDTAACFDEPVHFSARRFVVPGDQHVAMIAADVIDAIDQVVGEFGLDALVLD